MYVFNESRLTLNIMGHRIKGIGVTYIRHASVMLTRPLFRDKYTIGTLKVFTDRINAERYRDYFVKFHDLNLITMGDRASAVLEKFFRVPEIGKFGDLTGCKGVELTHWCIATALGCLTSGVKYTPEFMKALHVVKEGGASAAAVAAPDVPLEDTVFPVEAEPDPDLDLVQTVPDVIEDSIVEEDAVEAIPENTQMEEATVEEPVVEEAAPVEEVVEAPAEEVVEAPAEEVVEAPAEEVVEAPAEEVVEAPAEEVVEAPAEEVVEAPAEEVVEAPAEEAVPAEKTPPDPAVFDGMSIAAIREWAEKEYPAFAPAKSWTRDKLIDKLIEFASGNG